MARVDIQETASSIYLIKYASHCREIGEAHRASAILDNLDLSTLAQHLLSEAIIEFNFPDDEDYGHERAVPPSSDFC